MLIDKKYKSIIKWHEGNGSFQFLEHDRVAKLWGRSKRNEDMDYGKLSRSLRHYYKTNLMTKSTAKYMYKFKVDLKKLLGYSVPELMDILN